MPSVRKRSLRRLALPGVFAAALLAAAPPAVRAADPAARTVPAMWQIEPRLDKPDLSKIAAIRFLTETTYPPFNYLDEDGRLVGFNVDLARAICAELELDCMVRTRAWDRLVDELVAGRGDAIIASIAADAQTRGQLDFTDRYYLTPARFAVNRDTGYGEMTPEGLAGRTVGVVAGTAHEAYLKAFFPDTRLETFETRAEARAALKTLRIEALFDDGISLSFWLNGTASEACCAFRGGPWLDPRYFGEGVAIAVRPGNDALRRALNYGLRRVFASGKYEELFLRYFPVSFY